MKKLLFIILVIIIVIIIYILNLDKKIYLVNISDSNVKYSDKIANEFDEKNQLEKYINIIKEDYRITDLINDINNNVVINKSNQTIQNALIKADILVLKLGNNELKYKENTKNYNELFNYTDELINDVEKLFKLIRIYDKEQIYFINFKTGNNGYLNEIYKYLNIKMADLCSEYKIECIDINKIKNKEIENYILQLNK